MKLLPSIGAFSLVFFSVNAIAQPISSSAIYEGKIGNSNFTMHLDKNVTPEGKIIYGGEYFYNSQRKLINLIPVSYTHLDVYKRQNQYQHQSLLGCLEFQKELHRMLA